VDTAALQNPGVLHALLLVVYIEDDGELAQPAFLIDPHSQIDAPPLTGRRGLERQFLPTESPFSLAVHLQETRGDVTEVFCLRLP